MNETINDNITLNMQHAAITQQIKDTAFNYGNIPKEWVRTVTQAHYYLTIEGLTQKETATLLGVSEQVMGRWIKRLGWSNEIKALREEMKREPLKFDDSLSAFKAWLRIHHPDQYKNMLPMYDRFLKPF